MKQRGKRIRPSGKDLVFHFTIASLLPVFLLVLFLFRALCFRRHIRPLLP